MHNEEDEEDEDAVYEIGDELDLHTFRPKDVKSLVPDYIDECVARGIPRVRIIHGKGKGVQRRIVHSALERHPNVESFALGEPGNGGWGATLAVLIVTQKDEEALKKT